MTDEYSTPASLRPQELEAVYAISRAVGPEMSMETALDEIIRLARPVFIFDNMVLYLRRDAESVDPAYARAIGRGRSREAELVWGEATASEALQREEIVERKEEVEGPPHDRTRLRYSLGIPLNLSDKTMGALVFIRFGGPPFKPDQIRLAEFISAHVAQLLEHTHLVQRIASLEAERRLAQLQDDFVATVSHELLTPLGFIKGYATTLLRDDTSWDIETRNEFLTIIDEEADRLHELIENMMDSSRLQAGTLRMSYQPVRLDTFLKDIALRAKSRNEDLELQINMEEPSIRVTLDPARLAQVFDNLLTNAAKYAPGSPVLISLNLGDSGDHVHMTVSDRGPGISREHQKHIFKRFYRVDKEGETVRGTGLGLFICRQIIRAHGGEIEVESRVGKGTTFHIYLPLEQQEEGEHILLRENVL